jgi:2-polyprenyl-3-methyl-5-hydroxy-6-metoxy-1,4-benzoquinol methylase
MNGMVETLSTGQLAAPIREKIAAQSQKGTQATQESQTEEEVIVDAVENPLTTEDVEGREIEPGYEVFEQPIVIDSTKGRTNRKPFRSKASIKRDFEINDDDFVDVDEINGKTMVGFMGDVQVTGSVTTPTGLTLTGFGGPNYPAQANRNLEKDADGYFVGKAAVWASTFEDSTGKLMKRMKDAQGALIGAQQNTGILGNRLMLKYFGEELKTASEKINSEETIVNFINEKIKTQFKKDKNTGVTSTFSEALGGVESFSSIDEFVDYLDPYFTSDQFVAKYPDSNNIVQKGDKKVTLLEAENTKKGERIVPYELRGGLFVKMFNIDSHKKFGVPSIVPGKGYTYDKTVLEYANDTMFGEAGYGDFVGFVEFDPDTLKLEKVNQSSDFFNPSYEWVITAEKVRFKYFNEFLDGRALFYENTSASEKANQTPFGLRPKAAAARAIMGSQPTTTIDSEKVKERQKGFASKSQLTAPSSDKWSPSLTQAEVDNIVGGDFASSLDEKVKEGKKHSTQIATTVGTYNKWVTWLEKNVPDFKNAEVLDVGAGLGHIHKAFGNKAGVVESYEPFYDKVQYQKYAGIQKPNYSEMDASDVPVGKYDVVVNNAVLNVVPSDIRESILNTIGDALKPGGIAIINAMDQGYLNSLIKKIDAGQSKNIKLSNTEVFVRESGKNSYQKGWTPQELQSYVQDVLGNEFSVERAPSEITSMTTVLIKKNQMGSKSQLTDTVAESKKLGVPQRYKGDVGKFIGGDLYVHKSAMDILPKEAMENAASKLPSNFNYEIVKYNEKSGSFSFIASPDWNTNPEPIVGDAYKVAPDRNVTITKQKADPQIYHHKWNFVRDNYNGFDVQESVQRSVDWFQSVRPNVNMFKIGTQSYWQNEALPNLRTTQPSFKSKSQLDFTQIRPEYDAVMNQQFGTKKAAYRALIEKGYTPKRIKEAIGLYDFDESAFKKAQSEIAVNAITAVAQTYNDRQDEIKDAINQNIGDMESIYGQLIEDGFSNLEIFTAARDLEFLSPQDLIDIFGAEYRETVQRAINASTPYPSDFLDELEGDARTLKVSQKAADVADVVREAGLGLVDSAVAIDSLLEYLKTNGFDQIAIALTEGVKQFAKDRGILEKTADWTAAVTSGTLGDKLYSPEAINYAFSVSSELFSQAGRILQLARYFNETNQLAMIERQLAASGVVLTQLQKQTLESLVNDYKAAQADNKEKLKALEEDWSDQAWEAFNESEKAVGMATIRVAQFLEARKPIFWNERLTSGAARALLNVGTTILSFVANVENNIWSTNFAARTIQKFRDALGSGIKGNTLSFSNWKMARKLTSKRMWFDMNNNAKFGVMDTSQGINRYYDNLAQVNFFRDVKWNYNFMKTMVKKVLNRDFESMTPEEQADAYDLTLVKLKSGDIELRDGKTYTFARSLAWSLGTGPMLAASRGNASLLLNTGGPLFAEATGRIMSYGGDIAFGYMAAQRAMIDYFQNVQGTRFQNGVFDSMLSEADGKMDEKTIRALSEILRADGELYARFEKEGLKRTLLGDNIISGGISLLRGKLRKKIRTMYTENRKAVGGSNLAQELRRELLTGRGLAKNTLQLVDVGLFTLMPFTKVPVNFLGSAIAKTLPVISGPKYIFAEALYQFKYKQFNEKYPGIPALTTDKQKRDYEKAKIDLFSAKRQATYDAAQFVTSLAIYGIAMSAVKAGAILTDGGGDPEKEKALKTFGLRGGLYNATLHWEYIKAGMPSNFLARRKGFVKEGDVMLNTNNAGFLGYAMGLYASVYDGERKQEADNTMSLFDTQKSALSMLATTAVSSGIENLPMFQGLARIGELLNDLKTPESSKNAWNNFASGTLSTSTAVFFPSFFSFMSKGNAEMVQSAGEINKRAEDPSWPSVYGDVVLRVVQKLNRNISFNENTRNEYYEAQIGPFGEDLSYKVTLAEPGTAGAYVQAFLDPFAVRMFSAPAKENQREIQAYRESAQLFGNMTNLALIFQQMTGRDFEWKPDGKSSSFFGIITNPMKNQFTYSNYAKNVGGLDEENTYKLFDYNLPNDLYRQELKLRGEEFRKAMRKYIGKFETVRAQVQTYVEQGDEEGAKRLITNVFEEYQSTLAETQKDYLLNYQTNREKQYLSTMNNRKLFTEQEKQIMKKNGFMNEQGLIP